MSVLARNERTRAKKRRWPETSANFERRFEDVDCEGAILIKHNSDTFSKLYCIFKIHRKSSKSEGKMSEYAD
jgi:hypothetical protein